MGIWQREKSGVGARDTAAGWWGWPLNGTSVLPHEGPLMGVSPGAKAQRQEAGVREAGWRGGSFRGE